MCIRDSGDVHTDDDDEDDNDHDDVLNLDIDNDDYDDDNGGGNDDNEDGGIENDDLDTNNNDDGDDVHQLDHVRCCPTGRGDGESHSAVVFHPEGQTRPAGHRQGQGSRRPLLRQN